ERMIEYINGHEGVSWVTMEDAANDFRTRYAYPGPTGSPFLPGS
ncbi:MAG: polysaccharide deacetylase, partial [Modestobacter sp.]|nr:polysaccharide deacetylase [Modestobacter sp.]